MTKRLAIAAIALGLAAPPAWAAPYIYPQKGQSQAQQDKDQGECHVWATRQAGYDPTMAGPSAQAQTQSTAGGAAKGGLIGAAGGAAIGALAGSTTTGAAVGAVTGGLFGGMRRRDQNNKAQAQADAYNAQQDAGRAEYQRALAACLEGRGYTVR